MRPLPVSSQYGISLLETLLMLALVLLLATQAATPFSAWLERLSLTATTRHIVTLLRHGQQLALTRQAPVSATLVSGNAWCLALTEAPRCNCSVSRHCLVGDNEYRLPASATSLLLSSNRFSIAQPLVFNGLAATSFSTAGTFVLSGRQAAARIVVSPLGRVRACTERGALNGLPTC